MYLPEGGYTYKKEEIIISTEREFPWWEKYTLTVTEAAKYYGIGEKKIRKLIDDDGNAKYILWNGNRALIKRKLFEQFIDEKLHVI